MEIDEIKIQASKILEEMDKLDNWEYNDGVGSLTLDEIWKIVREFLEGVTR